MLQYTNQDLSGYAAVVPIDAHVEPTNYIDVFNVGHTSWATMPVNGFGGHFVSSPLYDGRVGQTRRVVVGSFTMPLEAYAQDTVSQSVPELKKSVKGQ